MEASSLQSILATLAQFGAAPDLSQHTALETHQNNGFSTPHCNGSSTPPGEPPTAATDFSQQQPQDPRLRSQPNSGTASPKPMIDPASITQWQEGLRCVTKIAAQNAHFAISIKRMMHDQKTNEMRWYTERQNLKQVQFNRSTSAANAQKILKSLPAFGFSLSNGEKPAEVDKAAELAEFDRKVYSAQQAMEVSMTAEMKRLGVPFFGTDPGLIVEDDKDVSQPESHPKFSPLVTEAQFLELRRKMIKHLEDLYRD